jgi:hypothetical protein
VEGSRKRVGRRVERVEGGKEGRGREDKNLLKGVPPCIGNWERKYRDKMSSSG